MDHMGYVSLSNTVLFRGVWAPLHPKKNTYTPKTGNILEDPNEFEITCHYRDPQTARRHRHPV